MANFKPIPIGVEDFKRMVDDGYYFVDKTLMIQDIIDHKGAVNLYTRPRRFGKTLNMSMIQRYFEKTDEDNSYLFEGLKISQAGEKYKACQGQFPVISLSLKSMKQPTYEDAFYEYQSLIINEFVRHSKVLQSDALSPNNRRKFEAIYHAVETDHKVYTNAIRLLSDCLKEAYQKNVIILIDEYDVPLENSHFRGFYDEMVDLIRSAFESALKTNPSLEKGILTGCLRVSKESIFTGLNNLKVYSVINNDFSEYFGFTESEVQEIAAFYGLSDKLPELKTWYDGYLFGQSEIYNPWSVLNYISSANSKEFVSAMPYWSNTSSNDIIRELIFNGGDDTRSTIEELINGGTVSAPIYEDITYRNIDVNSDYIWSFLLFTGYLKPIELYSEDDVPYAKMMIPNREVRVVYRTTVMQWFNENVRATSRNDLFDAIINGDSQKFEDILCDWLAETISYYDGKENYYHGFVSGLLVGFTGYLVKSNRESGNGRPDILILAKRRRQLAIIIEIKATDDYRKLDAKSDEALQQIDEKKYDAELIQNGYQKIIKYGIAFCQKDCMVKLQMS
jgi:hypothetical protein